VLINRPADAVLALSQQLLRATSFVKINHGIANLAFSQRELTDEDII
jgi:hypothetical protein